MAQSNNKDATRRSEKAATFRWPQGQPVAGASTNLKFNAQILSHSPSKGLFAGLELKGVVIKPDQDDLRDVYGEGVTAGEVLTDNKLRSRASVRAFPAMPGRYSSRAAKE